MGQTKTLLEETLLLHVLHKELKHSLQRLSVSPRDQNVYVTTGWPSTPVRPARDDLDTVAKALLGSYLHDLRDDSGLIPGNLLLKFFKVLQAHLLVGSQ